MSEQADAPTVLIFGGMTDCGVPLGDTYEATV